MDTNRLLFDDQDQSAFTVAETAIKAFFVVNAPRGNTVADMFQGGSFNMFMQRLGCPTRDYPGLKEAYDYVVKNGRSAWISAPPGISDALTNYYGGAYLTTVAYVYPFYKVTDAEDPNYKIQFTAYTDTAGTGGSLAATCGFDKGIGVSVGGTPNKITIDNIPKVFYDLMVTTSDVADPFTITYMSDASTTHTATTFTLNGSVWTAGVQDGGGPIIGTVSQGTLGASYKKLVFTDMTTLRAGHEFATLTITIDATDYVIASISQKSPREDVTDLTFSAFDLDETVGDPPETNPYYNTFKLAYSETIMDYGAVTKSAFFLSPVANKKDGQNAILDMNSVLENNNLLNGVSYLNTLEPLAGYTWTESTIQISISGTRLILLNSSEADIATSLNEGWTEAGSTEYSEAVIFVEPECYDELAGSMASLRTGTHQVSNFITGIKFTQSTVPTSGEIETRRGDYSYNKGLSFFANEFYMSDYLGKYYWHIPVGHVATMLALIIEQRFGGVAPMWLNESGLGGQLTTFSAKKSKYKFSADDLDNMDNYGINPIVRDSLYGYMMTSQKTAQAPTLLTDWSFLGHQMAFDSLKREIRTNVMIPQLGKAINDYYIDLRTRQAVAIVDKRIAAGIWADGKVYIREVNTDDTKAENKFIIKIRVKVNVFAEWCELMIVNLSQQSTV